ncbi:MAG: serine acetyltransferase, partial [Bacteroidetes bacterium]|nr:serine acetyltransferase [Bacteroidota bacterium]
LTVSKANASSRRHPTIENNVIIYSGATILGGTTVIGHDSIIGGNVWLTYSVPSWSVVYHKSEVKVRDNNPQPEALDYVI